MSGVRFGLTIAAFSVVATGLIGCAAEPEGRAAAAEPVQLASAGAEGLTIKVYKSPTCGCCASWVEHLEAAGFNVEVENSDAMAMVKAEAGVPVALQSCHTAKIGDYVFEGHVPIETIVRFMEEKPDVQGLAVPGMPVGAPGMEMGGRVDPYDVLAFDGATTSVYESRR
ncbi:MAG: DUF411 domain-containing protein [Gemmatimonadota bacterium]